MQNSNKILLNILLLVLFLPKMVDAGEFLDLQMSNEESFIIPGLDRAEQIRIALNSDYYFSRYDAADQTNNYSNSLIANNTIGTNVKPQYIENGSQFKFWRATIDEQTGDVVTPDEPPILTVITISLNIPLVTRSLTTSQPASMVLTLIVKW